MREWILILGIHSLVYYPRLYISWLDGIYYSGMEINMRKRKDTIAGS